MTRIPPLNTLVFTLAAGALTGGRTKEIMSATPAALTKNCTQLSVGGELTCALRSNGTVDCWNADESITHEKQGPYTAVSAGYDHQCGVLTTSDIQCWKS